MNCWVIAIITCALPETQADSWQQLSASGSPPGLANHALVGIPSEGTLYVFGGSSASGEENAVWKFSNTSEGSGSWQQLSPSGSVPSPRQSFGTAWSLDDRRMYIFGGRDESNNLLNDLYLFTDSPGDSWQQLFPTGSPPSPRKNPAAVWDPDTSKMYIFGGDEGVALNDLHCYDSGDNSWQELLPSGAVPSKRSAHAAVWDPNEKKIYVFGGGDGTVTMNDLHSYNSQSNTWTQLSPSGTPPSARRSMAQTGALVSVECT